MVKVLWRCSVARSQTALDRHYFTTIGSTQRKKHYRLLRIAEFPDATFSHRLNKRRRSTFCRFTLYDITSDGACQSRRWGTRDAIDRIGGEVLVDTGIEVDASAVDSEISGLTTRDDSPRAEFQCDVSV
jgi:hypothetical protein